VEFSDISQIFGEINSNTDIKEDLQREIYWKPADENEKSRGKI
jgi:hypothetical protein